MKQIVILGSTGSIGRQALEIVRRHPGAFKVVGLAAGRNVELLRQQITEFTPDVFAVADAESLRQLQAGPVPAGAHCAGFGADAVCAVARTPAAVVLNGLTGYAGLRPSLAALDAGSHLALANKESMVVAGPLLRAAAERSGVEIRPVDSEHSAIWQCLRAGARHEVRRLVLTASGGPFRTWPQDRLHAATVQDALRHPTWNMGPRITVDSATLLNKGLEVIEAHGLFGMPYDAVDVVVHPQSIVHSMVEFVDGSVVAQLGTPDMRLPIWIALQAPERAAADFGRLDLAQVGTLTFEAVDSERFPCLGLARQAGRAGGTFPAILNAANEVAVAAFLEGRIAFPEIAATIARVLDAAAAWAPRDAADLEQIAAADARARVTAAESTRRATVPGLHP